MVKSRWLNLSLFSLLGILLIGIVQTLFQTFLSPGMPQGTQQLFGLSSIMDGMNSGMNMNPGQMSPSMNMNPGQMGSSMNMNSGQMGSGMNMNSGMGNMGPQTSLDKISIVFNLILLVFVVGLFAGGIGFVSTFFRKKNPTDVQQVITK